jgi:hypothetical protein
MVVPKICRNGGAEHARGIHSRAGKRSSKQNVERDGRSDNETGDAPRAAFVNGGAVNDKHEKESENPFDQNPLPRSEINGELGSASDDYIAPEQTEANQGSRDSAETLRDPIRKRVRPFHMPAADQTEGHRWIQLASRDVQRGGYKSRNRQTVSEGNGQHIVPGGLNRANAYEDQRECSDKFSEERTKFAHALMQSNQPWTGNCLFGVRRHVAAFQKRGHVGALQINCRRNWDISRATPGTADLPPRSYQPAGRRMPLWPMREE